MTTLRILRQGDLSELPGRPNVITRVPFNREEEIAVRDRLINDVQLALKTVETMNQGMKAASRSWKSQGEDSPLEPISHLHFRTSGLQDCEIINLYLSHKVCGNLLQQQ